MQASIEDPPPPDAPNPFQIEGSRLYCVSPAKGGYRVTVRFCPGGDEMWETLTHFALFESEVDAEALLRKIQAKRGDIDLNYWRWIPSKSTPFTALQKPPVAMLETTPRPLSKASLELMLPRIETLLRGNP